MAERANAVPDLSGDLQEPHPEEREQVEEESPLRLSPRVELAIYGVLLLVAAAMRLWDLGSRAMHHDESLHALYSWYLYTGGNYVHNPLMHGPFQFHGTALVYFLFGDGEYTARLLPALFGIALVALPFFLRNRLGQIGALLTAVMLAFSPTLFYFSRFARNDIYMAVWTLGLVIVIWRYLETRQRRYVYLTAALLGLAFATKETAYIVTLVLGSFLLVLATVDLASWIRGRLRREEASPATHLFILMFVLSLPLGAAGIGLFQGVLGITLANPDHTQGPLGLPSGLGAAVIAGGTVLALLWVAFVLGHYWLRRTWWVSAAIFWGIWIVLYTTVFTNLSGVGTGVWQSLGYWIVQQDVARGGQPWYYYFIIAPVYELLPLLFAFIGGVYYAVKGDRFTRFLVYWALLTFLLYSAAGEKMPWLLVNVALPLIVLAGKFLGDAAAAVPWRRIMAQGAWAIVFLVPAFMVFAMRLALPSEGSEGMTTLLVLALLVAGIVTAIAFLVTRLGAGPVFRVAALTLAGFLLLFSVRAGWMASYRHGDVPVEMLVYTQTSPAVPRIAKSLQDLQERNSSLSIAVDSTDGYSWPWAWYLRDTQGVSYPCLSADPGCTGMKSPPEAQVVLLAARNEGLADGKLDDYNRGELYEHRWWFPEYSSMNYRDVTPGKFLQGLTSRDTWRTMLDYFFYRKINGDLGSSDAVVYYASDLDELVQP